MSVFDPLMDDAAAAADGVTRASSLVELAQGSDILIVAIPPTPSTLEVIDASVIDALPTGSLFVLLSRMAVVEQEPLWRRVRAEELRVGLDVFNPEPPPADAWFRTASNVFPTPHIAGNIAVRARTVPDRGLRGRGSDRERASRRCTRRPSATRASTRASPQAPKVGHPGRA